MLPHATDDWEHKVAIRLMGDCGLRRAEVLDVCTAHISRYTDRRHYRLEVVGGKDTTGEYNDGKHRETWLPVETERIINRYSHHHDPAPDDPLIDRSPRTLLYWGEQAVANAAEETGDEDYHRGSSYDLRRCWANHLLVEAGISPRIVMALDGWSSYNAIEPHTSLHPLRTTSSTQ